MRSFQDQIWFSGSSPDAALGREDQWSARRTGVLEGDLARKAQANAMTMSAFLNNQAREDAMRERDFSRNWQARETASRTGEFARQFNENLAHSRDVLKNQRAVDAAQLKQFANDKAPSGELEAQDFFSTPRQISDVDFDLLSRTTGLPEKKLRLLAIKADATFAETQAANLNAAFFAAQQQQAKAMKVPALPPDSLEKLRKSIEAQSARIHPLVKFNFENNAWEFKGGGKKSIAAPGEHVPIGRPPDTVTGTTPAFFAPPPSLTPDAMPRTSAPIPTAARATSAAVLPTISTPQEYTALPSGARFIWVYPDGITRPGRKP